MNSTSLDRTSSTAREPRPLGCRVYYCDPAYQESGNRITEKYLGRLKELADAHGVPWHYAPLHHFLNAPEAAGPGVGRVRLPLVDP